MNKPGREPFERFRKKFEKIQENKKKRQYIVPYFMSGHPGCTIADMIELAEYIRDNHLYTEQVQDFNPDADERLHLYVLYRHQPVYD